MNKLKCNYNGILLLKIAVY